MTFPFILYAEIVHRVFLDTIGRSPLMMLSIYKFPSLRTKDRAIFSDESARCGVAGFDLITVG